MAHMLVLINTETGSFGKGRGIRRNITWGGLGVINTKTMTISLMAKWIWRLFSEENADLLWLRLLKAKYNVPEFFSSNPARESPFWHSLHKIKEHLKQGAKFHPGRQSKVSFWKDTWLGNTPLSVRFPSLFQKRKAQTLSSRSIEPL
jgi:hypothetical protein